MSTSAGGINASNHTRVETALKKVIWRWSAWDHATNRGKRLALDHETATSPLRVYFVYAPTTRQRPSVVPSSVTTGTLSPNLTAATLLPPVYHQICPPRRISHTK